MHQELIGMLRWATEYEYYPEIPGLPTRGTFGTTNACVCLFGKKENQSLYMDPGLPNVDLVLLFEPDTLESLRNTIEMLRNTYCIGCHHLDDNLLLHLPG